MWAAGIVSGDRASVFRQACTLAMWVAGSVPGAAWGRLWLAAVPVVP